MGRPYRNRMMRKGSRLPGAGRALARRSTHETLRHRSMRISGALHMDSFPKFHNEIGVPIVRIGCREFKCIGDIWRRCRTTLTSEGLSRLSAGHHRPNAVSPFFYLTMQSKKPNQNPFSLHITIHGLQWLTNLKAIRARAMWTSATYFWSLSAVGDAILLPPRTTVSFQSLFKVAG
jgi:hypothetical protein